MNQNKTKTIRWVGKCKSMRFCISALFFMGLFLLNALAATSQEFDDSHYSGVWVFNYAEVQESTSSTVKKISRDEVYSQNYWSLVPLRLQIMATGEFSTSFVDIVTPAGAYNKTKYEWIEVNEKILDILKQREGIQITEQEMLEISRQDMEVLVSYSNPQVSGNTLSVQYGYTYGIAENEYVDGILTIYLKQE